ncbi:MAG: penicillin-binding transpeptidase domain-containing protein [Actinomycetota bacterium]|nr:penicillin-binding transpeptidase domain-containing protein [Actinomycetota bacterium]
MNAHLRRTFYLFVLGFAMLIGVLVYWQVYARESLATDPANSLQSQRAQETPRGLILAGDGKTELARSVQEDDGLYARYYPEGPVYSHVVGYWSPRYGASGIEVAQTNNLSGTGEPETLDELMNEIQGGPEAGNDVELTLDPELQRLAYDQLASSTTGRGAAVAINPKNGEVLALTSYPSYDPNDIDETFPELSKDPNSGLLSRATQGLYPPGSTFKVITTAAALKAGVKPTDKFKDTGTYETPGYEVYNYRGRVYGNVTFTGALANSINALFARIGYEYVGAEALGQMARDFGFGDTYEDFPLPIRPSSLGDLPPEQWYQGNVAQISFGQGPVTSNPFEMALVAATIANNGTMMEPRLVREVRSPDGAIVDKLTPRVHRNVVDKETAQTVNDMMQHVVTDVEVDALIPGVKVAGKTGTAEAPPDQLHSWFIAFAPADDPEIAVAVIVENGQEGYKAALPIARRMMETYLKSSGKLPEQPPSTQPAQPKGESTQPAEPKNQSPQPAQPKGEVPFKLPFQNPFQNPGTSPKGDPSKGPGG